MKKETIRITCDTKLTIPYDELHGIQGALKMLTKDNFTKLRNRILKKGVNFALHVWKERKKVKGKTVIKWWIIDGHGRHAVVTYMVTEEDFTVGPLPCVEIEADSFEDAKEQVLAASSNYHTMTDDGLYEFATSIGLPIEKLEEYTLVEVDLIEYKMKYHGEPESESKEEGERKKVEFDAYQNAAIKQIVLYFQKEQYEEAISRLDILASKWELDDHAAIVWRLLNEAVRA